MKLTILTFLVFFVSFSASASAVFPPDKDTWVVEIETEIDDIYPQAVQFTVMDINPILIYKNEMSKIKKGSRLTLVLEQESSVDIEENWDVIFKNVSGEELKLLPSRTGESLFHVASDKPDGKKWIVTKSVTRSDGTVIYWCLPIKVKKGEKTIVRLDLFNSYNSKN